MSRLLFLGCAILFLLGCSTVESGTDGITVRTKRGTKVRVEVIDKGTLHISTTISTQEPSNRKSILVTPTQRRDTFTVSQSPNSVIVATEQLAATIDIKSGVVSLSNSEGELLFEEGRRALLPSGTRSPMPYAVWQEFVTSPDEQLYAANGGGATSQLITLSEKDYGILWNNTSPSSVEKLDLTSGVRWQSEVADQIDYYVIYDRGYKELITRYHRLTGGLRMLPKWAFGMWLSHKCINSSDELLATAKEYRTRAVGLDNLLLDLRPQPTDSLSATDIDTLRFADPQRLVDSLHAMGLHLAVSTSDNPTTRDRLKADLWLTGHFEGFRERDSLLVNKLLDDSLYLYHHEGYNHSSRLLSAMARHLETNGVKGAERSLSLTRESFTPQHLYSTVSLLADVETDWSGMRSQLEASLRHSLDANPYWMTSIGGERLAERFVSMKEDSKRHEELRELICRWYQWGVFSPLFGSLGSYPTREIYNIAPYKHPAYRSIAYYIKLRYRLIPYIYSLNHQMESLYTSLVRPLKLDFAGDKEAAECQDQFMFGDAIMVCPILEFGKRSREVYLPDGVWYDLYEESRINGGAKFTAQAPYEQLPLYVRAGRIISLNPILGYTMQPNRGTLVVNVYTGADAHFTLYEDDGTTRNRELGEYSTIPISWDEKKQMLSIGKREGEFEGMNHNREFIVRLISESGADTHFIHYDGTEHRVTKR